MTNEPHEPPPGLPRRFLRAFLLLALRRDGQAHGYELYESVCSPHLLVELAGVYRDLRAMEQHDLVTSEWVPSESGPDRRVYQLTAQGHRAAAHAAAELEMIRDGLAAALDSFAVGAAPARP